VNELALFAGAGGGILGGKLLGWRTVCAVEWEQYPASVLCARQNDGLLPPFPIWDDVCSFDGRPWRGIVDVISGGFPCQDISSAGRGAGIDGERSGMWREMARIIREVQPRFVFVENSPMLTSRGLGRVLGDLASMGFDARWGVLGAADVGANHQRDRIWIVAKQRNIFSHALHNGVRRWKQQQESTQETSFTNTRCESERPDKGLQPASKISIGQNTSVICSKVSDSNNNGHNNEKSRELLASTEQTKTRKKSNKTSRHNSLADTSSVRQSGQGQHEQPISSKAGSNWQANIIEPIGSSDFWAAEPNVGRVVDGLASRVDRLKAIGNGQVPLCAATAWTILSERI